MIDWIILISCAIGYLWSVRFITGLMLDGYYDDGALVALAIVMGLMVSTVFPVVMLSRTVYVGWKKYGSVNTSLIETLFPGPKEIETKQEKVKRIERERAVQERKRRAEINNKERELGMAVTRW